MSVRIFGGKHDGEILDLSDATSVMIDREDGLAYHSGWEAHRLDVTNSGDDEAYKKETERQEQELLELIRRGAVVLHAGN